MKTIALVSPVGGAGRSTLTAELAGLLAARQRAVLAVECDPRNFLALHFGLREPAGPGLLPTMVDAGTDGLAAAALRSDDGVLLVPWGSAAQPDAAMRAAAVMHGQPDWLRRQLARVDLPGQAIALIDTAAWPSAATSLALAAADLALVIMPPEPAACALLARFQAALQAMPGAPVCAYVVNGVLPARQLHADILALLRAKLNTALLPYQIHADSGIPEALARGANFCGTTPDSQAAHDLQGLASWLALWADGKAAPP